MCQWGGEHAGSCVQEAFQDWQEREVVETGVCHSAEDTQDWMGTPGKGVGGRDKV